MTERADFGLEDIETWVAELCDERDAQNAANGGVAGMLFLFGIHVRPRARRHTYTHKQVLRMLETDDKRAIRSLLVALSLPLGRLRFAVSATLTRLLLSIEPGNNLDLLGPSRWRLFHALEQRNPNEDPNLLVAVLHALETIGTDEDAYMIRMSAPQRYNTTAEQMVSGAAQKCVVTIREREDRTRERGRLLRSTADQREPAELLRATPVAPHHEPDKLLRTAEKGAESVDP